MARSPEEIEARLKEIGTQIAGLGPALQGTVKKNRNRRVRKDGSVYVSPEHYTFVYRGEDGKDYMTVRAERKVTASSDDDRHVSKAVAADLRKSLLVSGAVELVDYGSLPRTGSKARRVIDRRD